MKNFIAFFLIILSGSLWAQPQDTITVKDGKVIRQYTSEQELGNLADAGTIWISELSDKARALSEGMKTVKKEYPRQVRNLVKEADSWTSLGVNASDTLLFKSNLLKQTWVIDDIPIEFRHNGKSLQYKLDTMKAWSKAYYFGPVIYLKQLSLFRINEGRYESVTGNIMLDKESLSHRDANTPPVEVETRFLYDNGTVALDGVFLRYDNRKKKWVSAPEPPPASVKIVKTH